MNVTLHGNIFTDMIKIRILKGGDYPVLSGWALNDITSVFIRERQREATYTRKKGRQ